MTQLYAAAGQQFVADVVENRIAGKLAHEFTRRLGHRPGQAEVRSWQNSLRAMVNVLATTRLNAYGVAVEYQLPQSSRRLDLLLTVELAKPMILPAVVANSNSGIASSRVPSERVTTFVAGRDRDVLHPSVQAGRYVQFLTDFRPIFSSGAVRLAGWRLSPQPPAGSGQRPLCAGVCPRPRGDPRLCR